MDRETILKHSKAYRLENKILPDFINILNELLVIKWHPEYFDNWVHLLQSPTFADIIVDNTLEYFEKEFNIIRVEKLPNVYSLNKNILTFFNIKKHGNKKV